MEPTLEELRAAVADAEKALDDAQARLNHLRAARRRAERDAEAKARAAAAEVPVDPSARTTLHGTPLGEHAELKPNGQQKDYVVLTEAERAKGFVRPVRHSYKHLKCGSVTTMSQAIAETYARAPSFYDGTFCGACREHFPVGADGEFVWDDGSGERVGT